MPACAQYYSALSRRALGEAEEEVDTRISGYDVAPHWATNAFTLVDNLSHYYRSSRCLRGETPRHSVSLKAMDGLY